MLKVCIIFCIVLISCSLYCYNTGKNDFYVVTLSDGESYSGRIVKEMPNGDIQFSTSYNLDDNFLIKQENIIAIYSTSSYKRITPPHLGSIGFGLGVPYGMAGLGLDIYCFDYIALTGGVGARYPFFDNIPYSAGLRFFPLKIYRHWSPKISLLLGSASFINIDDHSSFFGHQYFVQGFVLEIGQQLTLGPKKISCLDMGIIIPLKVDAFHRESYYTDSGYQTSNSDTFRFVLAYQRHF